MRLIIRVPDDDFGHPEAAGELNQKNVQGLFAMGPYPHNAPRAEISDENPAGTYNLSVRAANACGAGPSTAFQTVVIP